jgi:hypothetical protein
MKQDELARRVVHNLNYGLDRLDHHTLERLAAARREALGKAVSRKPVWGLAWTTGRSSGDESGYRFWVPLAALALLLSAIALWQTPSSHDHEEAEIDAALLADDLPVQAYTDIGFGAWLKPSSE